MADLGTGFEERVSEIEAYLDFLQGIEDLVRSGVPRLGENGLPVTVQQTRILYSSVYLQLYNLVEASITRCLDAVSKAAVVSGTWQPGDLTESLRREWVRVMVRSHKDLNYENRLASALTLCTHLVEALPVQPFGIEKGGGGNWDDYAIEAIIKRVGFQPKISRSAKQGVKQPFRNDKGVLGLIVSLRNELAHGSMSFAECGENETVSELRNISERTFAYLRDIVKSFEAFINGYEYLLPPKRPAEAA